MKPEAKIKAKIRRVLERISRTSGLPLTIDTPPASQYGTGGRPDHMIFFGPLIFFIEAKAEGKKPTQRQAAWHDSVEKKHGHFTIVCAGDSGVKKLPSDVATVIGKTTAVVQHDVFWAESRMLYQACLKEQERMSKRPERKSYDIA